MSIMLLFLLFYVLASASFLGYALGARHPQVNLLGLGVLFWSLVPLIQTLQKL